MMKNVLLLILLTILFGCTKPAICGSEEPIGCKCLNGNLYVPKLYGSVDEATLECQDSCQNKNGMDRLFCHSNM